MCRDLPPKLHVDPINAGLRGLVTFGDYVGGGFWARGEASGDARMEVTHQIRNRSDMSVGGAANGIMHDTTDNMVISTRRIRTARSHLWAPDIISPTTLWLVAEKFQKIT